MAQTTTGLRALLSYPAVYEMLQVVMGSRRGRREFVRDFVRPTPGMRVLDIGCGTGAILGHLPSGVDYWGYDSSPHYIAAAQRRFGIRGRFQCESIHSLQLAQLPLFDVVLAIGVLHHLDDATAEVFFRLSFEVLNSEGRVVTIDPCLATDQNPMARYLVLRDRGRNVRDPDSYLRLARQRFSGAQGTLRHRTWPPYTHWIMECAR